MLYQIKYRFDKSRISELCKIISSEIIRLFSEKIDVLIPIPPSNMKRPFQPVFEILTEISRIMNIPVDLKFLKKSKIIPAIKQFGNSESRNKHLKNAFSVQGKSYQGKTILLFDDHYRSGDTLNAATKVLKEDGEIANILILAITKTDLMSLKQ